MPGGNDMSPVIGMSETLLMIVPEQLALRRKEERITRHGVNFYTLDT